MLVLSRKLNERIHIGNGVVVTVTRIGKRRVRLGIDAPRDIQIMREELLVEAPSESTGYESFLEADELFGSSRML